MPVDAYNASIILKYLHTYYAQNYAGIIYLPLLTVFGPFGDTCNTNPVCGANSHCKANCLLFQSQCSQNQNCREVFAAATHPILKIDITSYQIQRNLHHIYYNNYNNCHASGFFNLIWMGDVQVYTKMHIEFLHHPYDQDSRPEICNKNIMEKT